MELVDLLRILGLCVLGLALAGVLWWWRSLRRRVLATSVGYQKLLEINSRHSFDDSIKQETQFTKIFPSKRAFDRADVRRVAKERINQERQVFDTMLESAAYNQKLLRAYKIECKRKGVAQLTSKEQAKANGVPFFAYIRYEKDAIKRAILHPVTDPDFVFVLYYSSPKGHNHYRHCERFSVGQIILLMEDISEEVRAKEFKAYQRKLMTNSLRYDILKRDGFRCAICGRTAADGVKLHVDHIIPVAKGGKTELGNLRTLCSECNEGKKDKYDPDGLN